MGSIARHIQCRMLCASACAYSIDADGIYTPPGVQAESVGWIKKHPPVAIVGGELNINACLIGVNNKDGIIVAFRGTLPPYPVSVAGIADWLHGIVVSTPNQAGNIRGKVHDGFWNALETIWPEILYQINRFRDLYPQKPLYLTGHSKGGSLACISAARIYYDHPEILQPKAVYTYGSPHPGDNEFVNSFPLTTIPVIRYENQMDVVPLLPPTELFIKLGCRVPIVGKALERVKGWDYAPLGKLQYIKDDCLIMDDEPGLIVVRVGEIVANLIEGESRFERLVEAHYHSCGYSYMNAICKGEVCAQPNPNAGDSS